MIALLQRVVSSSVSVDGVQIADIGSGLLVLVAFEPDDNDQSIAAMLKKITRYRVFSDPDGKMNLSLMDVGGELLIVPQFTLAADTRRGLRPSFSKAASPADGLRLFDTMVSQAEVIGCPLATGQFGADMQVQLINDGPVTFWLQNSPE